MTLLVDSHCHLACPEFAEDRDAVLARARAAGLQYLLVMPSGDPEQVGGALALAERHAEVYAAAGIHPHEAAKASDQAFQALEEVATKPKVLAIGEIGLDYYYDHSPREMQQIVLRQQLGIARKLSLPVVIHCRDAWPDLRLILRAFWSQNVTAGSPWRGGILHCFTGSLDDAVELMEMGFMVSFAGNLTFKKAENLRQVAGRIPLDRLLAETDSPFLSPEPFRGQRNEPLRVREVTARLAELHGLNAAEMGAILVRNFENFFRLHPDH